MIYCLLIIYCLFIIPSVFCQTGWIQSSLGTSKLMSVSFVDSKTGYVFTLSNKIYKTTDGGAEWREFETPGAAMTGSFNDANIGIYTGSFPQVTTNGGSSWTYGGGITPRPGSTGATIILKNSIMVNAHTGFSVGNEFGMMGSSFYVIGKIYRTTNSGTYWELMSLGGVDEYDVKMDKKGKLYVVWAALITSEDYGQTWSYVSGTNQAVFSMSEIFGDTIYLSATEGKLLRSFNQGLNWNLYQTQSADTLKKIFFIDNKTGWVCGDSGYVFHTTNSGTNWIRQNTGTTKDINGICFVNKDTGFAVGNNGLLLKTYTGGVVGVNDPGSFIPEKYDLSQNYPNPFNPVTKIRYELPSDNFVSIIVYDLLGREIKTVVNEFKTAGSYFFNFNGSGLPSGIYYYKMKAGEYQQIRKMTLIK